MKKPVNYSKFGYDFSIMLLVISGFGFYYKWSLWVLAGFIGFALVMSLCALFFPKKLALFHRFWFGFANVLGSVFNPLVLGVMFFGLITPIAIITRLFGRDALRIRSKAIKRQPHSTYWQSRIIVGKSLAQTQFIDQF